MTLFLLSPARVDGRRAEQLLNPKASFPLAVELRRREGVAIGEVFAFLSALYFRGKLAYAKRFGAPWVITTNRGLVPAETRVCLEHLEAFAQTDIKRGDRDFRAPLERDASRLAKEIGPDGRAVLLGSIASKKYVEPLLEVFGDRLLFPQEFVGRGDMSRGGLLLRSVEDDKELTYVPLAGAVRHGARPPKLPKR
jgi:hypothetical protein